MFVPVALVKVDASHLQQGLHAQGHHHQVEDAFSNHQNRFFRHQKYLTGRTWLWMKCTEVELFMHLVALFEYTFSKLKIAFGVYDRI